MVVDRERFAVLLSRYDELSGSDRTHGWPMRTKLEELGMGDVADGLERAGKLGTEVCVRANQVKGVGV